jgi:hypothetical protein
MGPDIFLKWRTFGRKSAKELMDALESLGYTVDSGTMITDPGCQIYLKIGRTILRNYFDYYIKNSLDDTEYIPVVRLIIEGIAQEMKSSGLSEPNRKEVAEKLKAFNLQMYQNIWIEHAKEDEDPDEEPIDPEKEYELAKHTFDYIYKHGKHPRNLES